MRNDVFRIGMLCAAFLFFQPSQYAAAKEDELVCPSEIQVMQKAESVPAGWDAFDSNASHPVVNISLSDGAPSEKAVLAPSRQIRRKGKTLDIWDFAPTSGDYWFACHYSETGIVFARRLPAGVKSCEIEYDNRFAIPVASKMRCVH